MAPTTGIRCRSIPQTGLVYLPAQGVPLNLTPEKNFKNNAQEPGKFASAAGWNVGFMLDATPPQNKPFGRLIAWDPVKQKEAWRAEYVAPWNGGTLTTAGNLVFQGTADGRFIAYNATTGEKLWETPIGTGVVAAASTYMIDGKQYVSIAVGWGGVFGIAIRVTEYRSPGTVYTFAIDGNAPLPAFVKYQTEGLLAGVKYDPKDVAEGTAIYVAACVQCHGCRASQWRQRPKPRLCLQGNHREPEGLRVQGTVPRPGHARLHRQAEGRGHPEAAGLHPGHRGRDPAEMTAI